MAPDKPFPPAHPSERRPLPADEGTIRFTADEEKLLRRFHWHHPTPEQCERIARIRWLVHSLAVEVIAAAPVGPERVVAIRQLHEAQHQILFAIVEGAPIEEIKQPPEITFQVLNLDEAEDS